MLKYNDQEMLKFIYDKRNGGMNWEDISREVETKFGTKIHRQTIEKMFNNYLSKSQVVVESLRKDKRRAKDLQIDWNQRYTEKFDQIDKTMSKLLNQLDMMMDDIIASNLNDPEEKYKKLLRVAPVIKIIASEVLNQMLLIKKEQERIVVNQKNVIYSPLQIMQVIEKELGEVKKDSEILIIDKKTGKVKKKLFA